MVSAYCEYCKWAMTTQLTLDKDLEWHLCTNEKCNFAGLWDKKKLRYVTIKGGAMKKANIFAPVMVIILLIGAFTFSRKLDNECEKYAKELKERQINKGDFICRTVRNGEVICSKATPQRTLKTKQQHSAKVME